MPAKTREPSGLTANHTSSCAGWREKCATTCGCLPTLRTRTVPVPSMPRAIEVEILPTQSRQFTPPHPRHQRHPEESGLAVGGHEVEELLHLRSRPSLHLHAVLLTRERERLRCRVLRRRVESRPRASLPGHGRGAPRVSSTKVFGCQPQPPTTETSGGVGSLRALPETLEARPGMSGLLRPSSAVPVRWWPFARLGRWLGKEGACHDQGSPQDDEHRASDLEVTRPDGQSGDQTTKFGIQDSNGRIDRRQACAQLCAISGTSCPQFFQLPAGIVDLCLEGCQALINCGSRAVLDRDASHSRGYRKATSSGNHGDIPPNREMSFQPVCKLFCPARCAE